MDIGDRIKTLRLQMGLTQEELGDLVGLQKAAINKYEKGIVVNIKRSTIMKMAEIFKVEPIYLYGKSEFSNIKGNARRINVYGRIPAGVAIEAITDIIDWEEIPADWPGEYLALQVKGDSMEPEYREGDVIIVRQQSDCESGQDCVVYVNGYDATLKRVVKHDDCLLLQPLNPTYAPKVYDYTDPDGVSVLGVVVEMRRKKS